MGRPSLGPIDKLDLLDLFVPYGRANFDFAFTFSGF